MLLSVLSGNTPKTDVPSVLLGWPTVVFLIRALVSPYRHVVIAYTKVTKICKTANKTILSYNCDVLILSS